MKEHTSWGLHLDLYLLNMAYVYFQKNKQDIQATFEVYFRENPFNNGHCVFVGSEKIMEIIGDFKYTKADLKYLKSLNLYNDAFLQYLANFRFSGNIYAPLEGEVVFANEPIMIVQAPIIEAVLLETLILNIINYQTLIATKASKMRLVTDKKLYEFGARRAYDTQASLWGSYASYIAGFDATSLVKAGQRFNIPIVGTFAHSFVQVFDDEYQAFKTYTQVFKDVYYLVDTYNVLNKGIVNAIKVSNDLNNQLGFKGIRIDSGDLANLSKQARLILDNANFKDATIMVSNDIDEHIIMELQEQKAPIDAFGIGTKLVSCDDTTSLGAVYKLVNIKDHNNSKDVIKLSQSKIKTTTPGIKMPYRIFNDKNKCVCDIIAPFNWEVTHQKIKAYNDMYNLGYHQFFINNYQPLLHLIIKNGKRVDLHKQIEAKKAYHKKVIKQFPEEIIRYSKPDYYPICLEESIYLNKMQLIKEKEE